MDKQKKATEFKNQSIDAIEDIANEPLRLSLDLNVIQENVGLQEYVEARKGGVLLVKKISTFVDLTIHLIKYRHQTSTRRYDERLIAMSFP